MIDLPIALTEAELRELTGYSRPAFQLQMLQSLGIPARKRPDNSVLVLRMHCFHPSAVAPAREERPRLKSSRK